VVIPNYYAPIGIASVAVIGIGPIVTRAGHIKRVRRTCFVMFAIAWVRAFPVLMPPLFSPWKGVALIPRSFAKAIRHSLDAGPYSGIARAFVEVLLAFTLMLVALVLPMKTLILGQGRAPGWSERRNLGARDSR
jgi:hypothetical protein